MSGVCVCVCVCVCFLPTPCVWSLNGIAQCVDEECAVSYFNHASAFREDHDRLATGGGTWMYNEWHMQYTQPLTISQLNSVL